MRKKLPFEKPKKRKKLASMKGLKKKAWEVFSAWVRQRGADKDGYNVCVTCGKRDHWKNMNASHFYHGKNSLSAMDDRNVWVACVKCNLYLSGNLIEYSEFLRKKFGPEIIDTLRELRHAAFKPTRDFYEQIIEKYST